MKNRAMSRTRVLLRCGATALAAIGCLQSGVYGAITTYSSRAAWEAAAGAHQTEDFESLDDLTEIPTTGGVFSTDAFDILIDSNHGRIGPASDGFFSMLTPGLSGTFFVGDVHSPESAHPHFNTIQFATPITAFAANFAALDDGGIYDIRIEGESFQMLPRFDNGHILSNFLGVTSTTPFTVVDIRNGNGKLERYGMDDVSFVAVPEPRAWAMALIGLLRLMKRA